MISDEEEDDKISDDKRYDGKIYKVVKNGQGQYSIYPADRENPLGWKDVGKTGLLSECLKYLEEVWTE